MERHYRTAVFTLVNNQPEFEEIWIKYYSQFPFRLVILEHIFEGEEEVVQKPVANAWLERRKVLKEELFDHKWMCDITAATQWELLKNHSTVIYTDIDELIVPRHGPLDEYCIANRQEAVRCRGCHLVERKYIVWDRLFNKPLVTRVCMVWAPGWHSGSKRGSTRSIYFDEDLWLVHLHRMDYDIAKKHWMARQKLKWDAKAVRTNQSWQNRLPSQEEFDEWFDSEKPGQERVLVPEWLVEKLQGIVF